MSESIDNASGWVKHTLLSAAGTGNGKTIQLPSPHHQGAKQFRTLYVWGTFSGATVALELSPDGLNWFTVTNADNITAKSVLNIEFKAPYARATVTGGGAPSINSVLL